MSSVRSAGDSNTSWSTNIRTPTAGRKICFGKFLATILTSPLSATRSEEHTSELQSLMRTSYAVFCLKQKKKPRLCTHTHSQNLTTNSIYKNNLEPIHSTSYK